MSLLDEAEAFAERLTRLIRGTVGGVHRFEVIAGRSERRKKIGPAPFVTGEERGFQLIPLRRRVDPDDGDTPVLLKVAFDVGLDDQEDRFLTVEHSTFGLWIRSHPGRDPRPVVRIEYDRSATSKPQAHVHLHAESVELGWLYGTADRPLPSLHEIHFPMGGRRFRPTLEDFLLFLDREGLFTDWVDPSWRSVVEESLGDFEQRQARATVRRHRDAAVAELRRLGYQVVAPGS